MTTKILQIEDNEANRSLVRKILENRGYAVIDAEDGLSGIKLAQEVKPALILMDINIPGLDGYETTTRIKSIKDIEHIPIVALTAGHSNNDRERCLSAGCIGYIQKPIEVKKFVLQIEEFLSGRRESIPVEEERGHLKDFNQRLAARLQEKVVTLESKTRQLEASKKEIEDVSLKVIASLTAAMEEKDPYTAGHSDRVTSYCVELGRFMDLSSRHMEVLTRSARLHDIGKLAIDMSKINKKSSLSRDELMEMRKHPEVGANILKPLGFLEEEMEVIRTHHERWDGTGYPEGRSGERINLLSCILTVADSFDAMISTRSYRKKIAPLEAVSEIERCRATQFNPDVVDAFKKLMMKNLL